MKKRNVIFIAFGIVMVIAAVAIFFSVKNKGKVSENVNPEPSQTPDELQDFMDSFDELTEENGQVGEYNPEVSEEYEKKIEEYKAEAAKASENLTAEQAENEGFVVITQSERKNIEKIKSFVEQTANKNADELKILFCNDDGSNMLIRYVKYDGSKYYGFVDLTRYEYSSNDYLEFEYPYCKVYETTVPVSIDRPEELTTYYMMYLVDDDSYSFDDLMNMEASQLADDWEKYIYICEYTD